MFTTSKASIRALNSKLIGEFSVLKFIWEPLDITCYLRLHLVKSVKIVRYRTNCKNLAKNRSRILMSFPGLLYFDGHVSEILNFVAFVK